MNTINCVPTWLDVLPEFVEIIYNGTDKQKEYVISELKRLCIIADKINITKK